MYKYRGNVLGVLVTCMKGILKPYLILQGACWREVGGWGSRKYVCILVAMREEIFCFFGHYKKKFHEKVQEMVFFLVPLLVKSFS